MKIPLTVYITFLLFVNINSYSQGIDKSVRISLFTGMINYQGDLNPNSFTFRHSNLSTGIIIHKPLNRWVTIRAGVSTGKIEAADKWNRDYLKPRNLSFTTSIKEIHAGFELNLLDLSSKKFTPYLYGGAAIFHFNPWAKDKSGNKTYLKPLSTEGQGLSQYPAQKPYQLTQMALAFGIGAKFLVSDAICLSIEFSQRKSFTDYIDDLSSIYVDKNTLLQEKGPKAVEMAYRGGELSTGMSQYPAHGDQRGTPSEMDWYYFFGTGIGVKLSALSSLFHHSHKVSNQRCPRNISR